MRKSSAVPAITRFLPKVDKSDPNGCWLWTASRNNRGYGQFFLPSMGQRGGNVLAHRWSYEHFIGPIPDGLTLDHLCRVKHCVNPAHLEPVTARENVLRSPFTASGIAIRKTHCINGHEFTAENTYIRPDDGNRQCRECHRIRRARAA